MRRRRKFIWSHVDQIDHQRTATILCTCVNTHAFYKLAVYHVCRQPCTVSMVSELFYKLAVGLYHVCRQPCTVSMVSELFYKLAVYHVCRQPCTVSMVSELTLL